MLRGLSGHALSLIKGQLEKGRVHMCPCVSKGKATTAVGYQRN